MSEGPHIDNLSTRNLRSPILNEYFGSAIQKGDVGAIAQEVMRRYLAKLSKHNDTGRLASTAKVTYHRVPGFADKRWEAEFSVGGGRVDYADDLEREYHLLSSVLREMGYNKGDGGGGGPTGRARQVAPARSRAREEAALRRFTTDSSAINNRLRNANDPLLRKDPATDADIREIRQSLAELKESQRLYRVHSARRLGDLSDLVGKSFPQSGFVSTSSDPTFTENRQDPGQVVMDLDVPAGVRARDISGLSEYGRGESEVLIEDGRSIRITEATRDENGVTRVRGVVE